MKKVIPALFCVMIFYGTSAFAQNQVKGEVRDERGPLPGVSVLIKHSTRGVQTDASGNFSISARKGDTLAFSFSGYASQELVVDDRSVYTINMSVDSRAMEDIVVVGYGTKKKQFLTGRFPLWGQKYFSHGP